MEFVEPDDEPQRYREPPPRTTGSGATPPSWAVQRPSAPAPALGRRPRLRPGASLLSTGLVVVAGDLLEPAAASRGVDTAGLFTRPTLVGARADVVAIADRVRPAIVQLQVERGAAAAAPG